MTDSTSTESKNFIEEIIDEDILNGKHGGRIHTRFPPEPNGYLHIGHAKAICINFELAQKYGGTTNLRFDDTNPVAEDLEFVKAIQDDIRWLGFEWEGNAKYTSNYFDELYAFAVKLIKKGLAYVDESSAEEMAKQKGTPTQPGVNSPFRDRTVEENLDLFDRMKAGEFDDGAMVLRAKIDMASPNMLMRDPVIYRIKKVHHHNTGDKWCI
ncbi:MAG: glutamine--tRNA ligase, partial [Saprospiraceae bacterium]|nr:glutamine--tRNA ligase [Bacteroidia bacterium]NNL93518.1 glutamine--tRNA ligase [Saprospiraceae bacterium]